MTSNLSPSKILCVGRNFRAHAAELDHEVPSEPLFFFKPPSSLIGNGEPIRIPDGVGRVDFEGEVAVVVGRRARRLKEEEALSYVEAVLPANDVTARDLQRQDSQWTRAKGFDTFCAVGDPVPFEPEAWEGLVVRARVNGKERQEGRISDLVFTLPFLLSHISHIMTLEPGDLLLTGTPSGVGPIHPGDVVEVEVEGVGVLKNPVQRAEP